MESPVPPWWRRRPGVRGTTRHFIASNVQWRAFEYSVGDEPGIITLMFASDTMWRRVRAFPANWAEMDDEALLALSWGR